MENLFLLLLETIVTILCVILGLIGVAIIRYVKKIYDKEKQELIYEIVVDAIFFAQRMGKRFGIDGDKKLKEALRHASEKLNNLGIKITPEMLEETIEGVLEKLKLEYGDAWDK